MCRTAGDVARRDPHFRPTRFLVHLLVLYVQTGAEDREIKHSVEMPAMVFGRNQGFSGDGDAAVKVAAFWRTRNGEAV